MDTNRYDVWAVAKDPGGTNGVLPVVRDLRSRGIKVLLIANGKAIELLGGSEDAKIDFVAATSTKQLLDNHVPPRVLLACMSSNGGVGRDLVPLLRRGNCITVALQDFWGADLWHHWADPTFRPDYIIVNDEPVGAKLVLKAWPEYRPEQVVVTGYPANDKYASINVPSVAARVRAALGLAEDLPIILFGGQSWPTGQVIGEVVDVLNVIGGDAYFVPRPHPRTKDDFAKEMAPWQEALARFRGRLILDWFGQVDTPSLIAAAADHGVVVSIYSTILVEAACLRGNAISVLYPDYGMKKLLDELQGCDDFPLVELGCARKAVDRDALHRALTAMVFWGKDKLLVAAQEKHFPLDGKNAERAADFITKLI